MIVELMGTNGAGKTTIEPLIAERLGIPYFPGKKRHSPGGDPLSPIGVWINRAIDFLTAPGLAAEALRIPTHTRRRLRIAADLARGERVARAAAASGSGVIGNGGLHRVAVTGARTGAAVTALARRLTPADVYVLLLIDPEEARRRMEVRLAGRDRDMSRHAEHTRVYNEVARDLVRRLGRRLVEVDSSGPPEAVATAIQGLVASPQARPVEGP